MKRTDYSQVLWGWEKRIFFKRFRLFFERTTPPILRDYQLVRRTGQFRGLTTKPTMKCAIVVDSRETGARTLRTRGRRSIILHGRLARPVFRAKKNNEINYFSSARSRRQRRRPQIRFIIADASVLWTV